MPGRGQQPNGFILVVDDNPAERELLRDVLEARGFQVEAAEDGEEALRRLQRPDLPDVVLTDVQMPGMDGFALCRWIRENEATSHLPVLIITALCDRNSRLRGISEGASDFLAKPIDLVDTHMRVRNAVASKKIYDQLAEKNRRLLDAEQARDTLVHMIVHDLKSPLTAVLGYCKLLRRLAKQRADDQQTDFLERSIAGAERTLEMVDTILSVSRLEGGKLVLQRESLRVAALLSEMRRDLLAILPDNLTFSCDSPPDLEVSCDGSLLRRILYNLVENATRFADRKAGRVEVRALALPGMVEFSVSDNGKGIPAHSHQAVFAKFSQAEQSTRRNHGLGLAFCRLAVESHGGRIWIDEECGPGAVFRFTIPDQAEGVRIGPR